MSLETRKVTIQKEAEAIRHPLDDLMASVKLSHPGLEKLAAVVVMAVKAKQCLIVVSPPGCGKSSVTNWIAEQRDDAFIKDSLTRASLKAHEAEWNGFTGVMLFDDVGKIDTAWSRVQTLTTMAEIVHGHFISKDSHQLHIEIDNFHGSCILNIQPNVLGDVVSHPTWHSNLADKSMRYYHLQRAIIPNRAVLDYPIDWGIPLEDVEEAEPKGKAWEALMRVGMEQWTRPRAHEHLHDSLRGLAALAHRTKPTNADMDLLLTLLHPLTVEMEVMETHGFGETVKLNVGLLYLLTEFASYPNLTYGDIAADMRMRERKVVDILETMVEWFHKTGRAPVRLSPSPELVRVLKKAGIA